MRVLRGHVEEGNEPGAETVSSGSLRLRPLDFAKQLVTFRARRPSTIGQVAAIGHFDALFVEQLWQIYDSPLMRGIRKHSG